MPRSPMTGTDGTKLFEHDVLGRHRAEYYLDSTFGYIWVDAPHWLDEAYDDAIALTDTGIMARNLSTIPAVATVMRANGLAEARGIDLGAGYGLFVRGIRDCGLDFHWSDAYAENLVARGFEADDGPFDVAVAFEVLEHLPDPLEFLRAAKERYGLGTIFFSATCFDEARLPGEDWWYWAFETGQHISFFSRRCLDHMAGSLGLTLVYLKGDLYAFTDRADLRWPGRIARALIRRKYRSASLTQADYAAMKARVRAEQDRR